jgi:putative ABC transport system permease protein
MPMNRFPDFLTRLRAVFTKPALDADFDAELAQHLEAATSDNIRSGMTPEEAARQARIALGGVEQTREMHRDARGLPWLEDFVRDVRFAGRGLGKTPGFTLVAVLTLALGIGSCTAIFSVINRVLLHPLETPGTERIVVVRESRAPGLPEFPTSAPNFAEWQKAAKSFASMAAYTFATPSLTGDGEPQLLSARKVTGQYFDVFDTKPLLGRSILLEECAPGNDHVVVVSHALWQRALGGTADAVGRTIQLGGEPYTVIGVAPPGFDQASKLDVWLPLAITPEQRAARGYKDLLVLARLKPGVSSAQANAEMQVIAAQLARQYPEVNGRWGAFVMTLNDYAVRDTRHLLLVLLGAVGGVLLIACANLANLLLARATARQREFSVRAALGASRPRLVRQLLTESLLLALAGGATGVMLAYWGLAVLPSLAPESLPRVHETRLDGTVLLVSLALSITTGIVFGLAPAWFAARLNVSAALKQGSANATEGGARHRLRRALVVLEIAAALVLLVGAGLLTRSFLQLARLGPGFDLENATALHLALPQNRYPAPEQRIAFADALLGRVRALPDVRATGIANSLPLAGSLASGFAIEGRSERKPSDLPTTMIFAVTPDYFQAMGIRLLSGRVFSIDDRAKTSRVVIINETLARKNFPGENPLGHRIDFSWGPCEIVGVVADVTQNGIDRLTGAQAYGPFAQFAQLPAFSMSFNLVVRSSGPPDRVLGLLRPAVYAVDRNQPVGTVRALKEIFTDIVARERFATTLLGVFSVVALVIAAIGIYGVMAYTVTQRTAEIGIRIALGATKRDVFGLVFGEGGRLFGFGLLLGLAGTWAAARTIESMLYHTDSFDPLTVVAITVLFAIVAVLACYVPARRATRVDPVTALRTE